MPSLPSTLCQGVEELASRRNVESLYLHVDVTNTIAISMYEKAEYKILSKSNLMYTEFTKSLDLHDGATKGRSHHLLCKHLSPKPTWLSSSIHLIKEFRTLGFVVPQ